MKAFASKTVTALVVAGVLSILPAAARAEIKNFTFQGTISYVDDMGFQLDGSITNGSAFDGFYIFDTDSSDASSDITVGDYNFTNSAFGMVVKVGNYVFRTNPRHVNFKIEVVDRPDSDNYQLLSYNNISSPPLAVEAFGWQLDDSTGRAVTNDSLPLIPPDLSAFSSNSFGLSIMGACRSFFIRGAAMTNSEAPAIITERPAVTVGDAIEVTWPSRMGYYYQIQRSEEMDNWSDIGDPVLGDGTVLSKFFARQPGKNVFYRAEIANFSK